MVSVDIKHHVYRAPIYLSILRGSMGVPATTFKGSLGNFERVKSDTKQCSAAQKYTTLDTKIYINI